jgi:hypothetical protein
VIADVAGALNLANAALVREMEVVLADESWTGPGIPSPANWLTYKAGVDHHRAATIITVAERRQNFPNVIARFDAGELSLEQVAELVKAPSWADADIEHWGTIATPARIRRSIKSRFGPDDHTTGDQPVSDEPAAEPDADRGDPDRVATEVTDHHRWRIRGEFDLASGATVDAALIEARERLWGGGQRDISLADCLIEVCERFLDTTDSPLRRDRNKVWLHLDADSGRSVTSTGVLMPDSIRDRICCDGIIQPVWETDGVPFNLGRAARIVPERTRRIVMLRDGGCRVPGCNHDRIIDIHHIVHWTDGGVTETWNLVALCPKHHRLHHNGRLGITGNADQADGLIFTDARGSPLPGVGKPQPPPGDLPRPAVGYTPPLMGRVDWNYVGLGWIPPSDPAPDD